MLKRFFHLRLAPRSFGLLLLLTAVWAIWLAALPTARSSISCLPTSLMSLGDRHPSDLPVFISRVVSEYFSVQIQSAVAQPVLRTDDLWKQVYQLVPDLPLENQYVNKETRAVSQNNTLISRFIRYHIYTKGRTPVYRLDWKFTLADYLGANERISASVYPGADVLRTNPIEGDIAAIQRLTRRQRDALVQALVTVFSPTVSSPVNQPIPAPLPNPTASPTALPATPPNNSSREPRPGDAQLLIP
ncbi:MAG: hypothetical protein HC772_08760 [Leptolyngbyaceae cyanobacterium CRU_2_3]|nr:hypothetical protein [Leptolyngbyaceae cyanobacterium CRU_2_3]